ncbi:MAG: hypothetical protein WCT04_13630 [Planctomycetota bacterium]
MRYIFCLSLLVGAALVLQAVFVPAFLPPVLRPDVCFLIGMAVLAYGSSEMGWGALFVLGLTSDLVVSGRFGLLTLCYVLAAGAMMVVLARELSRSNFGLPCAAGVAGTVIAHGLYCAFGAFLGLNIGMGRAVGEVFSHAIAAIIWCLPCIFLTGKVMYHMRVMSPEVQARWANDERMNDAHKRATA